MKSTRGLLALALTSALLVPATVTAQESEGTGVDCSAFVREVYREAFNVELPRNARAQYKTGQVVATQSQLRSGDLIFFDTLDRGQVTHVGVFIGDGEFAHASSSRGVTPARLKKKYYQRAYWGSRRLLKH